MFTRIIRVGVESMDIKSDNIIVNPNLVDK